MRKTVMEGDNAFLHSLDPDYAARDLVDNSFVKKSIAIVGGPQKFEQINIESPWDREEVISL